MQGTSIRNRITLSAQPTGVSNEVEPALKVVMVYEDSLTRHWATDLWARVGQLINHGGICQHFYRINDLTELSAFEDNVRAAAEADVLVISVRDVGELPISLCVWIEDWVPNRAGRPGALVALIGVPPQPDAQSGRAHAYLEAVAQRAGLDFLPHERKLPEASFALPAPSGIARVANLTTPWHVGVAGQGAEVCLRRGLIE